jgi:hypothetical protein
MTFHGDLVPKYDALNLKTMVTLIPTIPNLKNYTLNLC